MNIEPTDATLGAVVTGVQLAALTGDEWHAIESVFHDYAVLIFPEQYATALEQTEFARRFGEIEHLYGDSGVVPVSNQRSDGSLLEDEDPAMQIMRGNEGWHTDSSYLQLAEKASVNSLDPTSETRMLSFRALPQSGAEDASKPIRWSSL